MYSLKKLYRQKRNILLIIVFISLFTSLFFLFKYLLVTQTKVEKEIYDRFINRDLIIYEPSPELKAKLNTIPEVIFIYNDYEPLELSNDQIKSLTINFRFEEDMPKILKGTVPRANNELLLPSYIIENNEKIDLTNFLNQTVKLSLNNNILISFYVTGIYEPSTPNEVYYNLKNINYLLKQMPNSIYTGNLRVLIDHYKNVNKVISKIDNKASLYNPAGKDEINFYDTTLNIIKLCIIVDLIFTIIVVLVTFNINFQTNKKQYFIYYTLGSSKNKLIKFIMKDISIMLEISLLISYILSNIFSLLIHKVIKNKINNAIFTSLFILKGNIITLFGLIIFFIVIFLLLLINAQIITKTKNN